MRALQSLYSVAELVTERGPDAKLTDSLSEQTKDGPHKNGGVASAAFVRGPQMATLKAENMAFEIVRIPVFGIDGQNGFRPVRPAPYFTAFGVTEYPV
jgi:hypothetical protein